jgi:hypothetical protein
MGGVKAVGRESGAIGSVAEEIVPFGRTAG